MERYTHHKNGIYRNGFWLLDYNGNGAWDGTSGGDEFAAFGGNVGETPVLGDWNGDGRTKIGVYLRGFWALDFNGNGRSDAPDRFCLGRPTGGAAYRWGLVNNCRIATLR